MATKKVKKKQIEFEHDLDDELAHKPVTGEKKGKLIKTNGDTGSVEFVSDVRVVDIMGFASDIINVGRNYQVEFYRVVDGVHHLINLYHEYLPGHKRISWKSNEYLSDTIAVIKTT